MAVAVALLSCLPISCLPSSLFSSRAPSAASAWPPNSPPPPTQPGTSSTRSVVVFLIMTLTLSSGTGLLRFMLLGSIFSKRICSTPTDATRARIGGASIISSALVHTIFGGSGSGSGSGVQVRARTTGATGSSTGAGVGANVTTCLGAGAALNIPKVDREHDRQHQAHDR